MESNHIEQDDIQLLYYNTGKRAIKKRDIANFAENSAEDMLVHGVTHNPMHTHPDTQRSIFKAIIKMQMVVVFYSFIHSVFRLVFGFLLHYTICTFYWLSEFLIEYPALNEYVHLCVIVLPQCIVCVIHHMYPTI